MRTSCIASEASRVGVGRVASAFISNLYLYLIASAVFECPLSVGLDLRQICKVVSYAIDAESPETVHTSSPVPLQVSLPTPFDVG